jgi:hypothetical protein
MDSVGHKGALHVDSNDDLVSVITPMIFAGLVRPLIP